MMSWPEIQEFIKIKVSTELISTATQGFPKTTTYLLTKLSS